MSDELRRRLSRRQILRGAAVVLGTIPGAALLAACGAPPPPPAAPPAAAPTAKPADPGQARQRPRRRLRQRRRPQQPAPASGSPFATTTGSRARLAPRATGTTPLSPSSRKPTRTSRSSASGSRVPRCTPSSWPLPPLARSATRCASTSRRSCPSCSSRGSCASSTRCLPATRSGPATIRSSSGRATSGPIPAAASCMACRWSATRAPSSTTSTAPWSSRPASRCRRPTATGRYDDALTLAKGLTKSEGGRTTVYGIMLPGRPGLDQRRHGRFSARLWW